MRLHGKFLRIGVSLALLLALMLWGGYEAYKTFKAEAEARTRVTLTSDLRADLKTLLLAGLDAETGQRGFVLTNDESYLEPYDRGVQTFLETLQRVEEKARIHPSVLQRDLFDELEKISAKEFYILGRTVDLVKSGKQDEALALVKTDSEKIYMDQIRQIISRLETEERRLLNEALTTADNVHARTINLLKWLAFGVFLMGFLTIYFTVRTYRFQKTEIELAETKKAKAQIEVISGELIHRVNNIFAVVTSIVRSTGRNETEVPKVVDNITGRVQALARSHAITSNANNEQDVMLRELIQQVLNPYNLSDERLTIEGPAVMIPARSVTPLGMMLHELATNAVKYGALTLESMGAVSINWAVKPGPESGSTDVTFRWAESGGPSLSGQTPERSGFGSKMIQMSLAQLGGTIKNNFLSTGLVSESNFKIRD